MACTSHRLYRAHEELLDTTASIKALTARLIEEFYNRNSFSANSLADINDTLNVLMVFLAELELTLLSFSAQKNKN